MHAAPSVIIFSVFSGLGFGYLAMLMISPPFGAEAFGKFFIAYAFAVSGLLAASFHLANPKNAIKAFRQWSTSWLSREAWAAVITLGLGGLYALALIFGSTALIWLGWIVALLALFTVLTTSMIYTQIRAIPRWHQPLTPVLFLGFAISGGMWLAGSRLAIVILILTAIVQIAHWLIGDKKRFTAADKNSATGLKGEVSPLFPAHTSPNYLMKEMVHTIGRKHAQKLRIITLIFAFLIPIVLGALFGMAFWVIVIGAVSYLLGALVSRWLFFAEAEHSVSLYYT